MNDTYLFWITEACKCFNGLDICTVDAIHDAENDKNYIMEINGTSSGFHATREVEDHKHLQLLVIQRMSEIFCK